MAQCLMGLVPVPMICSHRNQVEDCLAIQLESCTRIMMCQVLALTTILRCGLPLLEQVLLTRLEVLSL
jgi:hypothetical protein